MITENARVTAVESFGNGIYGMWIRTAIARESRAGQFVAVYTKNPAALLQRPISICRISDDRDELRIVYRVAGLGTAEFSEYKEGDEIRLLGPCGNGFDPSLCKGESLLVGGGIGLPPMLGLGDVLAKQGKSFKFVLGYRDSRTFLLEDFNERAGESGVIIATDDGSMGTKGTVTDAIKKKDLHPDTIFACGPMPMLRAIRQYAEENGIKAYISLEERMACGVGACLGCVCRTVRKDEHSQVNNARICVEGPVFDAADVLI